ncbi:MAG: heavy metal-responsive transcriptional regulator [Caldilineae bacterium]|nr:MAG: heavy metal-responsive transcriptional regulator [Caldilineae bacterium]
MNYPLRIGQLAQASGVAAKTIRYYEEAGLLPPPLRAENGYRLYTAEDVRRLRFVRNARALGFSLAELREVLAMRDQGQAPCIHVVELLHDKVAEIETRIRQLQTLRRDLQDLLAQAGSLPIEDVEMENCICGLIRDRSRNPKPET